MNTKIPQHNYTREDVDIMLSNMIEDLEFKSAFQRETKKISADGMESYYEECARRFDLAKMHLQRAKSFMLYGK